MIRIAPSLLAADFANLESELRKVETADMLHLDIMDGLFVPNISFGPGLVSAIRSKSHLFFDAHLMIDQPERFLKSFKDAGADGITVHAESTKHVHRCISEIRSMGLKAGLALNPGTPVEFLDFLLSDLDMILLMTVNPGFGGQKFIPWIVDKIKRVRGMIEESGLPILLQVDGGINTDTAKCVIDAGADVLVAGVAVFRGGNPAGTISDLRNGSIK